MRPERIRTVATVGAVCALLAAIGLLARGETLLAGLCFLALSLALYVRETRG